MAIRCVIVLAGDPHECYSGKGGDVMDRRLCRWGPDQFPSFVRQAFYRLPDITTELSDQDHFGSEECGVLVDARQKLLLFTTGGAETTFKPDWAGVMTTFIKARWPGWEVRWFADDWDLIADELGVDCVSGRSPLYGPFRSEARTDPGSDWIRRYQPSRMLNTLVSFRSRSSSGLAFVGADTRRILGRGSSLINDRFWRQTLHIDFPCKTGLHLDYEAESYTFYAHSRNGALFHIRDVFAGWQERRAWTVHDFETVVGPALTVERQSPDGLLREVALYHSAAGEVSWDIPLDIEGLLVDMGHESLGFELLDLTNLRARSSGPTSRSHTAS